MWEQFRTTRHVQRIKIITTIFLISLVQNLSKDDLSPNSIIITFKFELKFKVAQDNTRAEIACIYFSWFGME